MRQATSISIATNGITVADQDAAPPAAPLAPRRRSPLAAVMLVVAAGVGLYLATPETRAPVLCDVAVKPQADTVIMLSAAWCGYCRRARVFLQDEGIAHCEYDVESSARGRTLFAEQPLKVIPVLMIKGDILIGFNREEIRQSLAAHGIIEFED